MRTAGKVVASAAIGEGCDATAFDAGLGFSVCVGGDGTITVIKEDGHDKSAWRKTVTTQKSARTMAVMTRRSTVYVAANVTDSAGTEKSNRNSFVVLVVEQHTSTVTAYWCRSNVVRAFLRVNAIGWNAATVHTTAPKPEFVPQGSPISDPGVAQHWPRKQADGDLGLVSQLRAWGCSAA